MIRNHNLSIDPLLKIGEVAILTKKALRTIRENCTDGRFSGASKDSLGFWLIPLSSLPPLAQAKYWTKNLDEAPSGWKETELKQLPEEEIEALWKFFEGCSEKLKQKAYRDTEACQAWQVMKTQGIHFQAALEQIKQEFGLNRTTIYEKLKRIEGYEPINWPALLVGQWRGENAKRAEWNPEAWRCFFKEAKTAGRKIKTAWEYTKRQAEKCGWGKIPSYDTAKSDFKKIPHDVLVLLKEGETALKVKSPTLIREYDLPLHDTWSLDGRRIDLMVIDREGKYGIPNRKFRPWIYAYQDVRSRVEDATASLSNWISGIDEDIAERNGDFFMTPSAETYLRAFEHAREPKGSNGQRGVAMIYGASGTGKTVTAKWASRMDDNVVYVQADGDRRTWTGLLNGVVESMNYYGRPAVGQKQREFILRQVKPGGLIIFDHAQLIKLATMEQLLIFPDQDGIALAFIGNTEGYKRFISEKLAHISSRVRGAIVFVEIPGEDDIDALLEARGIGGRKEREFCLLIGRQDGGLRYLDASIFEARKIAYASGTQKLDLKLLKLGATNAGCWGITNEN